MEIIQIYKWAEVIEKPEYNTVSRDRIGNWQSIVSRTGFLKDDTLYLSSEKASDLTVKHAGLVIIQDIYGVNASLFDRKSFWPEGWYFECMRKKLKDENREIRGFSTFINACFELFRFYKKPDGCISVELHDVGLIGNPKRIPHKVGDLETYGSCIRYKINGKSDNSWSSRRQRTYTEFDYVICRLGKAERIEYVPSNRAEIRKDLPKTYKLIDERKILY